MERNLVSQKYDQYSVEDHETWSILCERQKTIPEGTFSKAYFKGIDQMQFNHQKIVNIDELSDRLYSICGWTIYPVAGLIPTRDFFFMLINKQYPVTVSIRKPGERDFSEQPDIFHDVFGHLPLLTNEVFSRFLTSFSIIALKYVNNERAIDYLGRLYWYTYEMGLIMEDGICKPYGGAVITSASELKNMRSEVIPKHPFNVDHIFNTVYNPYKLQNEYFVIKSFEELFNTLYELEDKLINNLLLPENDNTIRNFSLNINISEGFNNVIGFLNDIQYQFPQAISFVAGQPDEKYFDIENHIDKFNVFVDHLVKKTGKDKLHVINKIGQYSKTKGIINDILSMYLLKDENIKVNSSDILVTLGAQEAFSVIVSSICNRDKDVILVENPSYIGLSSFAKIFGYKIDGVGINEEGIDIKALKSKILEVYRSGKMFKLLYVIPDYQNPSGSCMPIGNRLLLLELARQYNFLIIEDSVYNSFTYAQKRNPTLKSLDKYNRVIYVGSFSKSLFPGLRIGLIAANQLIENDYGQKVALIDEMVKVKAQLTNNTPTINQAILGGILLTNNFSILEWSKPKFESYKRKRDKMIESLEKYIGQYRLDWSAEIKWNIPDGGFFIKMSVPFEVTFESVENCAINHGVIFCPMKPFYLDNGGIMELRLTFSNLTLSEIENGIVGLSAYLKKQVATTSSYQSKEGVLSVN